MRGRTDATDTREQVSILQLEPRTAKEIPSPFGDFSAVLKTLPGVASTNELTSTYSVRGGNYEENLIYVNGFEVYRPFLVTTAQQEGLSFVNPDLVNKIEFSTGGWQPKFGDKLSSVLNIEYKQPVKFGGSATASLVGGSAHVEAASPSQRVSYLAGVRYKNATYVFNSLQQQQGGYNPTFYDGQSLITLALGPQDNLERTTVGIFNTFAHNDFRFNPESGETTFNTGAAQATRLYIGYEGRERMQYDTYQGGIRLGAYAAAQPAPGAARRPAVLPRVRVPRRGSGLQHCRNQPGPQAGRFRGPISTAGAWARCSSTRATRWKPALPPSKPAAPGRPATEAPSGGA